MRLQLKICSILLMVSCTNDDFNEYPPSKYLSLSEQQALLDKFIYTQYDSEFLNQKEVIDNARTLYKLSYYTKVKNEGYFLVTYKGGFLSNGLVCFGGHANVQQNDTILDIRFDAEIPTHFTKDSVKSMFNEMLK